MSNLPSVTHVCPECFIGHLHLQKSTYVVAFGDVLMSVPNTPALKCDICHAVQFDPSVVSALEALIAQEIRLATPNTHHPASANTLGAAAQASLKTRQPAEPKAARPRRSTGRKTLL